MRLTRLSARGFRNLQPGSLALPPNGAIILGANGQGKSNLLEALDYPVLFRSIRGAADEELVRFGAPGFELAIEFEAGGRPHRTAVSYAAGGRRKRIELDGSECHRIAEAAGTCLAVTFLPADVALVSGPALLRRRYLDRTLALADRRYLKALTRYRSAVAQRNAALRQGRSAVARAFDGALAEWGAEVIAARLAWVEREAAAFRDELGWLGETDSGQLSYTGSPELADPAHWAAVLEQGWSWDQARGRTGAGPHRDDLEIRVEGRSLREYGSTGQQRSAAVALRLRELATLERERGETPVLLLDDVFAELDRERQAALGRRLLDRKGQVFVTAPRAEELPAELGLPTWRVEAGLVCTER